MTVKNNTKVCIESKGGEEGLFKGGGGLFTVSYNKINATWLINSSDQIHIQNQLQEMSLEL